MTTSTSSRLSKTQLEQYHREGYTLVDEPVFSQKRFDALKAHFEKKLAAWPSDKRPEAMDTPHFDDPELLNWALAPEVVDIVEPILGSDIILFSTHFICKPIGDGRRVPWHEDSAYWKGKLDPMEVCTLWLAIDPSTTQNGCMHVIPKTHNTGKQGFSDYDDVDIQKNVFSTEITPQQRRDDLAIPLELKPNQCSLHDARLMHGSPPNTSGMRRCGWTLRFAPAHVRLNESLRDVHLIYQARGKNLTDQPIADPNVAYTDVAEERKRQGIKSH